MSTSVSGVNAPTAANAASNNPSSSSSSTSGTDKLANEQTFLQLLVSQLQNQDPLTERSS
jgi:flagellar hook assembly protein FlgD